MPSDVGFWDRKLPLNGTGLCRTIAVATLAVAAIQLLLGASPVVLALVLAGIGLCVGAFFVTGTDNLAAWTILFFALGNFLVALFAKTILFQPVDSNLYEPLPSFLVLVLTTISMLAALYVARRIPVGRPVLDPTLDPGRLKFLSGGCFLLGICFSLLNRFSQDTSGASFGGFAILRHLILLAVIARTAAVLIESKGQRRLDVGILVMTAVGTLFGALDDQKTAIALPVVGYFATLLFFLGGFPYRTLAVFAIAGSVFVVVIAPMAHVFRALGEQHVPLKERAEIMTSVVSIILKKPAEIPAMEALAQRAFENGYYNYFGTKGTGQMVLGRFASVQQIDPVIVAADRHGLRGGAAVWPAFERMLPRALDPGKPQFTEGYLTLVHYGLVNPQGGKFPTLPLAGQSYAAYGYAGDLIIPFITFLGFFLAIKKWGWNVRNNVFGIFIFAEFVIVLSSQGDFGQFVEMTIRSIPIFLAMIYLIDVSANMLQGVAGRTFNNTLPTP
jgi:hypothetical protein